MFPFYRKVDFGPPSSREMIYFWKFVNHSRHLKTPLQSLLVAGTQEEEPCVEWTSGGKGWCVWAKVVFSPEPDLCFPSTRVKMPQEVSPWKLLLEIQPPAWSPNWRLMLTQFISSLPKGLAEFSSDMPAWSRVQSRSGLQSGRMFCIKGRCSV